MKNLIIIILIALKVTSIIQLDNYKKLNDKTFAIAENAIHKAIRVTKVADEIEKKWRHCVVKNTVEGK